MKIDFPVKSHTTTTRGANNQPVFTLLVNLAPSLREGNIYRVTVDADSYAHQAKVNVCKWTSNAGFQKVTQELLEQHTKLSGLSCTNELLNTIAWEALNPVIELFS